MNRRKYILFVCSLIVISSCDKTPDTYVHPFQYIYIDLIDSLEFTCPNIESNFWFKGTINEDSVCYFDGFSEKFSLLTKGTQIETTRPELVVGLDSQNEVKRFVKFGIRKEVVNALEEDLIFTSPLFDFAFTGEDMADTIFLKREWGIRSNSDSTSNIKVDLRLHSPAEKNGFHAFPIASHFGGQRNSYMRFTSVEKTESISSLIYDVEMELLCNLYLDPRFNIGDFYGVLRGEMKARFEVRKQ